MPGLRWARFPPRTEHSDWLIHLVSFVPHSESSIPDFQVLVVCYDTLPREEFEILVAFKSTPEDRIANAIGRVSDKSVSTNPRIR